MKRMKKVALLLVAVMLVSVLGGCGNSFDASAYMKAVLDNSYKNDSADFVKMKVGTKEEAEKVYEEGIDKEMEAMTAQVEMSDELKAEFREVIKSILKEVKYTVGDAEKQDDGSYVVTIKYQQMIVFATAAETLKEQSDAYVTEMTEKAQNGEDIPSEDEMNQEIFTMLKDALKGAMENVTYGEEQTTTVKIELVNKVYTPNEEDVFNLESALVDVDAFSNL